MRFHISNYAIAPFSLASFVILLFQYYRINPDRRIFNLHFLLSNRLTGSCHPLSASNRAGCLSGQRNIGPMPKVSRASQHGTIVMAGFGTHR